ncbi:hypothetical protein GJV76_10590 [Myroides sp. BIT-d1]|uniref:Lipoprotein n=1 Tax=Myroides albus TaxID=2562892 RepID=A0A6I3LLK5_9FLAO|nr:hypothetical protein [Myroides albus]MTG98567.1 hypothetical protein [Myroides albus]
MGRIRLTLGRYVSTFLTILSVFFLVGCKKDKIQEMEDLKVNKQAYLLENIRLEKESHIKFVSEISEQKKEYFDEKINQFIEDYDSFGMVNILRRRVFKTNEENVKEISQSMHLAFNLLDYQEFEQKKINEYLDRLQLNRRQFELGEKEFYTEQEVLDWRNGTVLQNIKMGANQMVNNIEEDATNEILNLVLIVWDFVAIVLFILSLVFGISSFVVPQPFSIAGSIFSFFLGFILLFYTEGKREAIIRESLKDVVSNEFVFKESNALLIGLNKNTEFYYNSGQEVDPMQVRLIMDEDLSNDDSIYIEDSQSLEVEEMEYIEVIENDVK